MSSSAIKPIVNVFLPCEEAATNVDCVALDLKYGWWEIRRPLHTVQMPAGRKKGYLCPEISLYCQLSGGVGNYWVMAELWQLNLLEPQRSKRLMWSDYVAVEFENRVDAEDRLAVWEGTIRLVKVPFPKPGMYQFQLKESGLILQGGESYLRVLEGEQS